MIRRLIILLLISISTLFSSRFWGAISKDGYSLSSHPIIGQQHISNQLTELREQGSVGDYFDWPYNSGSGWGLLFYNNLLIDTSSHITRSALPAFEDPTYLEFSNAITSNVNGGYLSLGHVRRASSGSDNPDEAKKLVTC